MVVSSKQHHAFSGASNIDVRLGNESLKQIDCIDYLGVKLERHLSWNDQIGAVCKKLVLISRLSRLRHVLATRILMYIYQGKIQSRFYYAITIWGFNSKYNLCKVQRMQNRVARIITGDFDYVHVRGIDILD